MESVAVPGSATCNDVISPVIFMVKLLTPALEKATVKYCVPLLPEDKFGPAGSEDV